LGTQFFARFGFKLCFILFELSPRRTIEFFSSLDIFFNFPFSFWKGREQAPPVPRDDEAFSPLGPPLLRAKVGVIRVLVL